MTQTTAIHPPRTMLELYKGLPEGTRVQLIENDIVMSPAPLDRHQLLLMEISAELFLFVKKKKLGTVRVAPYVVYVSKKNVFQPDICFISNDRAHLIKEDGLHGAPDLVIEILSPTTAQYDLVQKKDAYEKAGVKEYWIIDPADKTCTGYKLTPSGYEMFSSGVGIIQSVLLSFKLAF